MYALECVAYQTANVEDLQVLATFLVWDGLMPKAAVSYYTHKSCEISSEEHSHLEP